MMGLTLCVRCILSTLHYIYYTHSTLYTAYTMTEALLLTCILTICVQMGIDVIDILYYLPLKLVRCLRL